MSCVKGLTVFFFLRDRYSVGHKSCCNLIAVANTAVAMFSSFLLADVIVSRLLYNFLVFNWPIQFSSQECQYEFLIHLLFTTHVLKHGSSLPWIRHVHLPAEQWFRLSTLLGPGAEGIVGVGRVDVVCTLVWENVLKICASAFCSKGARNQFSLLSVARIFFCSDTFFSCWWGDLTWKNFTKFLCLCVERYSSAGPRWESWAFWAFQVKRDRLECVPFSRLKLKIHYVHLSNDNVITLERWFTSISGQFSKRSKIVR